MNHDWLRERAILAPRNESANSINSDILGLIPGDSKSYKSLDTVMDENQPVHYPTEFLNSSEMSGVPPT